MPECKTCGTHIEQYGSACPSCGHSPATTSSFEPVKADKADELLVSSLDAESSPLLVVRKGPQLGETFFIEKQHLTIGRDPASDIFLNDMTVSRFHAEIRVDGEVVTVRDQGSLNGTYVNGTVTEDGPLHNGDIVQVGTFQMTYLAKEQGR